MNKNYFLNPESRIKLFNPGWWFYMLGAIIFLIVFSMIGNQYNRQDRLNMVLLLSLIELIILRIYKFSLKNYRDDYNYFNELPCYLCNQSTILCIIASYFDNSHIMAFCIIVGSFGALLAVFMPDSYNVDQPFYCRQAFGFYGYHCLLIVSCLSFATLNLYKADPKEALWIMLIIFVLALIAHIINYIMRKSKLNKKSNFVFTYDPDNLILEKLYNFMPIKLLYLLPIMFGFGIFSFIILSIFAWI